MRALTYRPYQGEKKVSLRHLCLPNVVKEINESLPYSQGFGVKTMYDLVFIESGEESALSLDRAASVVIWHKILCSTIDFLSTGSLVIELGREKVQPPWKQADSPKRFNTLHLFKHGPLDIYGLHERRSKSKIEKCCLESQVLRPLSTPKPRRIIAQILERCWSFQTPGVCKTYTCTTSFIGFRVKKSFATSKVV